MPGRDARADRASAFNEAPGFISRLDSAESRLSMPVMIRARDATAWLTISRAAS